MDSEKAAIKLSGSNILDEHCFFDNVADIVTLHAYPGSITVSVRSFKVWSISHHNHAHSY